MSDTSDPRAGLAELSEARLLSTFGPNAVSAGRQYVALGRVGKVSAAAGAAGQVLQANVRGTRWHSYQTVVRIGGDGTISSFCSCPVRTNCKHGAAVLVAFSNRSRTQAQPRWQQVLGAFTEQDRRVRSGGQPLAIEFQRSDSGEIRLRLLTLGRSGRWIRTGVSFDTVDRGWDTSFDEAQRRAVAALRQASRSPHGYQARVDTLSLSEFGPAVWELLADVRLAGVAFHGVPPVDSVRLLDGVAQMASSLRGRQEPAPDGQATDQVPQPAGDELPETVADGVPPASGPQTGVELRSTLIAEGHDWELHPGALVGDPAHGVAVFRAGELVLGRLAHPLTAAARTLLVRYPRLEIPAAEVSAFTAGFLPSLQRSLDLTVEPGLDLPLAQPPVVRLDVEFGERHTTRLRWRFRYRIGSQVIDLTTAPAPGEPPVRDPIAEAALLRLLPEQPWAVTDAAGRPELVPEATLSGVESAGFVTEWLPQLQELDQLEIALSEPPPVYRRAEAAPQVSVGVSDSDQTDWFDLAVTVSVDGEQVEFRELFTALARGESHLILDSGTWFSLERPEFEQLRVIIDEALLLQAEPGSGLRLRLEHAGLWQDLVDLGVVAEQSRAWQQAVAGLLNTADLPAVPAPSGLRATLRSYQVAGYRWLSFLWRCGLGGILADDMGLGKTLQVLAVVAAAAERGDLDHPVLVVAPTSVVGTWAGEAERFAPGLRVRTVEATAARRPESLAALRDGADVVVTSYTLLRLEDEDYARLPWAAVVLDEAQFVKNRATRAYKAVRRLSARVKFAVTGTPLENNLMDLWSLLSITAPGLFADPDAFAELYRRPIESGRDPDALARLHRRVRPLMLRRTKEAVATELPPKQEQVLEVALGPGHRRIYDRHLAAERKRVLRLVDDLDRNRVAILRSLTVLRQLSLSPALVEEGAPAQSAKIDTLIDLVTELAAEGHRTLVFSQFTRFLRLVRDRL
ncbi:MAG: SNF2-related protein, partial [Propionicimonas sp.]|nr:SNF2-related protein [Propionicimonas sp.]